MNRLFLGFIVGFVVAVAANAEGGNCPNQIHYQSGGYLKNGDNYFYSNGQYLIRGQTLYYPAGSHLRRNDDWFYPTGAPISRSGNLYYPSGSPLKVNDAVYWSTGQQMKRGNQVFYADGSPARKNGTLYRIDGSKTPFPITLNETIDAFGSFEMRVASHSDSLRITFEGLVTDSTGLRLRLSSTGSTPDNFEAVLPPGYPGEQVLVGWRNGNLSCNLASVGGTANQFSVQGRLGSATVVLKPGVDELMMRQRVQEALDK